MFKNDGLVGFTFKRIFLENNELIRLERTTTTGMADILYEYDILGNQIRTGLDVDGNGSLDASSTDRIPGQSPPTTIQPDAWIIWKMPRVTP